jgi:hypothetical protein
VGCLPILATGEQPAGSYNGMFSPVISSRDYLGTSNSTPFFGPDFRDYPFMYPPRDHTVIYKGETIVKNFDRNLGGLYMAIGRVPLDATSVRVYVLKGNIGFGDQVTINPPDLSRIQTYFDADVYRSAINHVTIIEPFELIVTAYL